MKKYNVKNYIRYKNDLQNSIPEDKQTYDLYTRDELIIKFLPLVENMAHKFSTMQQASGVNHFYLKELKVQLEDQ
jgi:DNA-directed RNA polymerase specialized sigma subunit